MFCMERDFIICKNTFGVLWYEGRLQNSMLCGSCLGCTMFEYSLQGEHGFNWVVAIWAGYWLEIGITGIKEDFRLVYLSPLLLFLLPAMLYSTLQVGASKGSFNMMQQKGTGKNNINYKLNSHRIQPIFLW